MDAIVECAANFSEGRDLAVVDAIVNAIGSVRGVYVLHRTSDPDHNRSVITFAGTPYAMLEAAYQGIAVATRLIDMETHRGAHPRLGAADVVPFIPIRGVTLTDCAQMARALGARVGAELKIPVYLYEAAASRPNRQNLADVRRGEYETLKHDILHNPDRAPDFGPSILGRAGACIIGAREALIAFNVYLNTPNVEIAKHIARAVRHSSGGLRGVKALGLLVNGQAQVSMNLTDPAHTPLHRVVELIRRESARYGTNITRSELIGLIPQRAMLDAAQWYLQLDDFTPDRVLEDRLADALTAAPPDTLDALLSRFAEADARDASAQIALAQSALDLTESALDAQATDAAFVAYGVYQAAAWRVRQSSNAPYIDTLRSRAAQAHARLHTTAESPDDMNLA